MPSTEVLENSTAAKLPFGLEIGSATLTLMFPPHHATNSFWISMVCQFNVRVQTTKYLAQCTVDLWQQPGWCCLHLQPPEHSPL